MMKRVKFGQSKIQKLNRVAIPNSLLENLNISEGEDIDMFLDVERREIVIKKKHEK